MATTCKDLLYVTVVAIAIIFLTAQSSFAQELGAPSKGVWVFAEGVGANRADATKDAFRNAVGKVLGWYVDGEYLVNHGELIRDKVLVYSNGIVSDFKEIRTWTKDDMVFQTMLAKVEPKDIANKLKTHGLDMQGFDGRKMYAQIITKRQEEKEARMVLQRLFEYYPVGVLQVKAPFEPKQKTISEIDDVTLEYDATLSIDKEKYRSFLASTLPILDKIAYRKGTVTISNKAGPKQTVPMQNFYKYFLEEADLPSQEAISRASVVFYLTPKGLPPWWTKTFDPKTQMVIVVDTMRGKGESETQWSWYHVPLTRFATRGLEVRAKFIGSTKIVIKQHDWYLERNVPGFNCFEGSFANPKTGETDSVPQVVISPYFHARNCFSSSLLLEGNDIIPLDRIREIRDIVFSVREKNASQSEKDKEIVSEQYYSLMNRREKFPKSDTERNSTEPKKAKPAAPSIIESTTTLGKETEELLNKTIPTTRLVSVRYGPRPSTGDDHMRIMPKHAAAFEAILKKYKIKFDVGTPAWGMPRYRLHDTWTTKLLTPRDAELFESLAGSDYFIFCVK